MKYFGSKQIVQPDENEIAAGRLMAIANRFKADLPSASEGFEIAPDGDDSTLDLFDQVSPEPPEIQQ